MPLMANRFKKEFKVYVEKFRSSKSITSGIDTFAKKFEV